MSIDIDIGFGIGIDVGNMYWGIGNTMCTVLVKNISWMGIESNLMLNAYA